MAFARGHATCAAALCPSESARTRRHVAVVSGSSHRGLAERVASHLGLELCNAICEKFSNTECRVEILTNLRGCDVFILQTGGLTETGTTNDHFIEALILIDACRRSHSNTINVVMPCFPYGRQDKKDRPRVPMSGQLVANLLQTAGATRLILMDLHAAQIQGFFNIPVDNLYCLDLLCAHVRPLIAAKASNFVVVSPHTSGAKRCFSGAKKLGIEAIIMDTRRDPLTGQRTTTLLGAPGDVANKRCIMIDDVADTMGTAISAARTLKDHGALDLIFLVTHGMFSGPALSIINEDPFITKVLVANTLPQDRNLRSCPKLEVVDVSELLAHAIHVVHSGGSLSALFGTCDRLGTSLDLAKSKPEQVPVFSPPSSPVENVKEQFVSIPSLSPMPRPF